MKSITSTSVDIIFGKETQQKRNNKQDQEKVKPVTS